MPASGPPAARPRARWLGVGFGELPTGPHNAITDVPGVLVGHVTCWSDDPVARTGVTAILPCPLDDVFARPPAAGVAVLNGVGELTGSISITELGFLDTPILLTGTTSVGRAYDAIVDAMFDAVPTVGDDDVVAPVVGECDDSWLDDARRRNVTVADGRAAIATATGGPVAEGVVGAGTGMITMEYKGGIGTSSRVLDGRRARSACSCWPTSAAAASCASVASPSVGCSTTSPTTSRRGATPGAASASC